MPGRDEGILRTRISDELREKLERSAKAEKRSIAAEVAYRLERSFKDEELAAAIRMIVNTATVPITQELQGLRFDVGHELRELRSELDLQPKRGKRS
jgi:predicted solute-binding protein